LVAQLDTSEEDLFVVAAPPVLDRPAESPGAQA
jgi:hypothetical protein